ncbi:DUF4436 family protein [Herbiconiux sp.]|uniref:DUF4436 family protein n=1 Tax=Herbiconiux sp. TaxID=1871186 RepID=UPI0025BF4AFA|nr:DUF4436 family protein [Herbiconiux sp.]
MGTTGERVSTGRRNLRRGVVAGIIVFAVLAYVAVVLLYAAGGRGSDVQNRFLGVADPEVTTITFSPMAVIGLTQRIEVDARISPAAEFRDEDGVGITREIGFIITPVDGEQSFVVEEGSLLELTKSLTIVASSGAIENWPLDRYTAAVGVLAYVTDENGEKQVIPTEVKWEGFLTGWDFTVAEDYDNPVGTVDTADGRGDPVPAISIQANRSLSTIAFGVVLLGLLVVMPALVLFVAIRAFTGRRKVEATLTSWMGAMLFATVPLRTFLPGSPPIGSWIDYLIVLWVVVGLITGLVVYVLAWNRWGTPTPQLEDADADGGGGD